MKRFFIDIEKIASFNNLFSAALKAGKGKQLRRDAQTFFNNFDRRLLNLRENIISLKAPLGIYKSFVIHDPKKRTIRAACFEDRVFHHALINQIGPVLDRALIPSVFACRKGKGNLAAVLWVQQQVRRHPWYVKIDIKKYFDSIDHLILMNIVKQKLKGDEGFRLIKNILGSYKTNPGKGLPIGALTSQHFANYYLNRADRFILEELEINAYGRYMDDMIWWCSSPEECRESLVQVKSYLHDNLELEIKNNIQINRSSRGVTFCGFRISPHLLKVTRRRMIRYKKRRRYWEALYERGRIDSLQLQRAYDAVESIIAHGKWQYSGKTRNCNKGVKAMQKKPGAVAGSTMAGGAVLLTATGTIPATGTTTLASALPESKK